MGLSAFKFLWWAQTREITWNSKRIRPYGSSRSSKVIDLGVNRKPICDFLLVINSNFGRILHRFRDIAAQRSKNRFFALPRPPLRPPLGGTPSEFVDETYPRKTRVMGLPYGENCMILASNVFDWATHVTDRQTDRRTDGIAIAYTRYSIYAVARKNCTDSQNFFWTFEWKTTYNVSSSSGYRHSQADRQTHDDG